MRLRSLIAVGAVASTCFASAGNAQTPERRAITFKDMISMHRVSGAQISPDGNWIAYEVATPDLEANRMVRNISVVPAMGGESRQVTRGGSDTRPRWSPDGKKILFLSESDGAQQIYSISMEGGDATRLSSLSTGADNSLWSPNGKWIAFISSVYPGCGDDACNAARDAEAAKSKAKAVARARRPSKKVRPVARRRAQKVSEEELVRETVSEATGARFEVVPPHPAFPLAVDRLEWFMRCRNQEDIVKAPYLNAVWKEKGAGIWLESLAVGDTIDWIELAYGDEKAGESLDLDYSRFEDPSFQETFKQRFPIVMARIREYEQVAADVSKKRRVRLQIRRAGSKGMLVFTVAALVRSPKRGARESLGSAVKRSVLALREAYQQIAELYGLSLPGVATASPEDILRDDVAPQAQDGSDRPAA